MRQSFNWTKRVFCRLHGPFNVACIGFLVVCTSMAINFCYYYKLLINILGVARHEKLSSAALYNMHKGRANWFEVWWGRQVHQKKKGEFLTTCCTVATFATIVLQQTCNFSHVPERWTDERKDKKRVFYCRHSKQNRRHMDNGTRRHLHTKILSAVDSVQGATSCTIASRLSRWLRYHRNTLRDDVHSLRTGANIARKMTRYVGLCPTYTTFRHYYTRGARAKTRPLFAGFSFSFAC